jgi:hypothetical protein
VVNYDYDEETERTIPAREVQVRLRLPFEVRSAKVHRPRHDPEELRVDTSRGQAGFVVPEIGPYAIVELN